jgi:uncharacterized protein YutE (UPF0331/DUF86 family)
MTPADRQTLARKLEFLRKQLRLLDEYRLEPKDVVLNAGEKRLAIERLLELSLQSVIDCSRLMVAFLDWRRIRDDRDAFLILADRSVIDLDLCERMVRAKGFRNVLVHEYVEIDPELLYDHLQNGLSDLWAFAEAVAEWLRSHRE